MHIIYGTTLRILSWSILGQEVPSAYGRQRFNVMGVLDSETHETITVSITSNEIVELFKKVQEINNGEKYTLS
jgi:hypothetical protein